MPRLHEIFQKIEERTRQVILPQYQSRQNIINKAKN